MRAVAVLLVVIDDGLIVVASRGCDVIFRTHVTKRVMTTTPLSAGGEAGAIFSPLRIAVIARCKVLSDIWSRDRFVGSADGARAGLLRLSAHMNRE
jgi:hypothetical protein